MNIALRRFGAPILSHFCRMLLEAVRFIRFTMGADVAGCARFKRLENQELIQSLQTRWPMSCNPEVLKHVPLFALLDEEETAVLARQFHASQQLVRVRAMRNPNDVIEAKETLPERIADSVVQFGGSWTFIIGFLILSSVYTAINVGMRRAAWDPYPFILLNLILSLLAAIQAPVIMMSQNRQDRKDRVRSELDYAVNRRAESEIQGLARKLNLLGEKMGDLENLLRGKPGGGARGDKTGG